MPYSVTFIFNPKSGLRRRTAQTIKWIENFATQENIDCKILKTAYAGHGTELAERCARDAVDIVVAIGGDGTINEIGKGLLGSSTALGIIPSGSGNGFARNLDIPLNRQAALDLLRVPGFKKIDVGVINGRYFFNIAGIGLDVKVTQTFEKYPFRGPLPYVLAAAKSYFEYEPEPVTVDLEDQAFQCRPLMICLANLPEFGMNATIAPGAQADDGLLDICVINPMRFARAVRQLPKLFSGRIAEVPEVRMLQSRKLTILRGKAGYIHTDGDLHMEPKELTIELIPQQLTVVVPKPALR